MPPGGAAVEPLADAPASVDVAAGPPFTGSKHTTTAIDLPVARACERASVPVFAVGAAGARCGSCTGLASIPRGSRGAGAPRGPGGRCGEGGGDRGWAASEALARLAFVHVLTNAAEGRDYILDE